jgi:hypothetical protein
MILRIESRHSTISTGRLMAILKMATGRNCSMSRINSGHHYLPTYQIIMISDNVDFLRYCGGHFKNISTPFHMWVYYDVWNWFMTLNNFYRSPFSKWPPQYRKNSTLSYRTMLIFCDIVVAILKMATGRNCSMSWIQNGHNNTAKIQHCPISSQFDMWVDNDVPNWFLWYCGGHFENGDQ